MKRIVLLLLCIGLFAIGCATTNPCAPRADEPYMLEQHQMNMTVFTIRVYDTNKDGEPDTFTVYLKPKDGGLIQVFEKKLTPEQIQQVKDYLREKQATEKFKEEERKFEESR